MLSWKERISGTINDAIGKRKLKPYYEKLKEIKSLRLTGAEHKSTEELQEQARELRHRAQSGEPLHQLFIPAAGLVDEAVWRLMGIRLYDVQWLASMALYAGYMVEMQTGEGKTLAAVLPAYLHALSGRGVHIFTFNDYLATRDAAWMGPIFEFLGLRVGCVREEMTLAERKAAYAADVTYLTAKQAGFDYLRDSLVYDKADLVQRPFHYVLIDEADSIMIDEARIPLVIAGEAASARSFHKGMAEVVAQLKAGSDYDTDENKRNVYLTEVGMEKAEALLGCGNLYDTHNSDKLTELNNALHAEALLKRDVDYIVRDGEVQLIDEFTGRIADKRHWPEGLQRSVEIKEGLKTGAGGKILGMLDLQHLLSLYPQICGMTATAHLARSEFKDTYSLDVLVIPPNKPCRRVDSPHLIFSHMEAKHKAIINEILFVHHSGRPILVGTASVEESNRLAADLQSEGVECQVLNAQNDREEAAIIAKAGMYGAVTVSTNMAGRGVDIILGAGDPEQYEQVAELGGLYVLGTHLHESARVDKQLSGRAGRQGDPGSSRYLISLEDDLLVQFGIAESLTDEERQLQQDTAIRTPRIHHVVHHIQRIADGQNVEIKKTLNRYADMLENQRKLIASKRCEVLHDQVKPNILAEGNPQLYAELCGQYGAEAVAAAEKRITLLQIDRRWSDHLDYVAYVKEGIHLESIGNKNPLDEFNRLIIQAYEGIMEEMEEGVLTAFASLDQSKATIDLSQEERKVPSATWTYMINDQVFQKKVRLF